MGPPAQVGAGGVVLGGGDEVEPGRPGRRGQLGRGAAAVGVHGVGVQVPPVPAAAPAGRPLGRRVGDEGRPRRSLAQGDLDLPGQPLGVDGVGAEHDLPGALADRAGQVAGGGARPADGEAVPGPARPAPDPGPLVEHPEVEGVARHPGRGRGPVVAVADGQLAHPGRHLDRQVEPVGPAGPDGALEAAPLREPGHRVRRRGACGSRPGRRPPAGWRRPRARPPWPGTAPAPAGSWRGSRAAGP